MSSVYGASPATRFTLQPNFLSGGAQLQTTSLGLKAAVLAFLLIPAVLGLSAPPPVFATTVIPLSVEEMVELADHIAVIKVESTSTREIPGAIETIADLRVLRALKQDGKDPRDGRDGPQKAKSPGGKLGGMTMVVPGAPAFQPGETALLFLDDEGRVIGGPQGKLRVEGELVPQIGLTLDEVEALIARSLPEAASAAASAAAAAEAAAPVSTVAPAIASSTTGPTITGISPNSGSAGTGTLVTITGSGFGVTRVGGGVDFAYRYDTPVRATSIREWTPTRIVAEVPIGYVSSYPASAGSGYVTVVNSLGERSNGVWFDVTFGYGGIRWQGNNVSFRVNANTADTAFEGSLVDAAASAWSAAGGLALRNLGASAVTDNSRDGQNTLFWSSDLLPAGMLAQASYWTSNGIIYEADIVFNDYYNWGDGNSYSVYDVQSTALHELGHWLNLRDLYGNDREKVMFGQGIPGLQKRVLSAGDIAGLQWIYGAGTASPVTSTTSTTRTSTTSTTPVTPPTTSSPAPPSATTTSVPPTATTVQRPAPVPSPAPVFPDVSTQHEFYPAISYLAVAGVIGGYADGTFGPYNPVLRAQLAKMAVLGFDLDDTGDFLTQASFPDVPYNAVPYPFQFVERAARAGIISGYGNGYFGPFDRLTRIQLVRILVRAAGDELAAPPAGYDPGFSDVPPSDWGYVATAHFNGLVNGKSESIFDPYGTATRGHVAKVLYNTLTAD